MRLATFNILHGRSLLDDRVDTDRFAGAVATLDADVLALQEVDRDQPRSGGADLTAIAARAMGAVESRFVAALSGTPGHEWRAATGDEPPGTPAYGIALLTRFPVRDWQVLRLPALPVPVPFRHHGQPRPHLVRDEPRVAVLAMVQTPTSDVLVAATHLSYLPGWNIVQLARIVRALRAHGGPKVLMGDLNMTPSPARRITGLRPLASDLTFPSPTPSRQIDHILSAGLPTPGPSGAVPLPLSDHLALTVEVPSGAAPGPDAP